ncbi:MAG: protoheme IX farnesyltransferase [Planctomycetes bacterium]|nr:protoheme IX farnesyltransferase [Planctomycetota bacterium]
MNVRVDAKEAQTSSSALLAKVTDLTALMKLRLNLLVLAAVATGYVLGATVGVSLPQLAWVLAGVLLAGGGSSALNMAMEADRDRLMERTRHRPVASGRVSKDDALLFGATLSVAGIGAVAFGGGWLAAALCAATILLYVAVYTPLKTRSPLNTWVGAVPGALPPLIGWAAATGSLSLPALTLFGIVFFWQFPHFFAIASIYKDDYERAGFKMLPVVDSRGLRTAHQTLICAMALIPVSLLPSVVRIAGPTYFTGAFALGMIYLVFSVRASITKATPAWRDLLRTSLVVLPGLFVLMMVDRLPL